MSISVDRIRNALHRLGPRWGRERWDVGREDRPADEVMDAMAPATWNAELRAFCLLRDGPTFRTVRPLRRIGFKKAPQAHVIASQQNSKWHSYGAPDFESGDWITNPFQKAKSDATIADLQDITAVCPDEAIVLVGD